MTEGASETVEEEEVNTFTTKIRWVIPHRLDFITFIGKDVCAVAHDVYITFYNFKFNNEMVYVANNHVNGDGIDCIAGHRSNIFAFAEKSGNPRIFIVMYPSFIVLAELKDTQVNRYKGLCLMENDLICGFSGFPNYVITIWSWRTGQRLLSLPTNITRRDQIYMASRTHMLVCECYHEGLIVWEVAPCYKKCFMMKRAKEKKVGWEVSEPPLIGVCWSNEGQLYAIDENANLFSILSDGIDMVSNLEWSGNLKGANKPHICSFGNGLLIYGPDKYLRSLKKCETKWKVVFEMEPHDEVVHLLSNSTADHAALFTAAGLVYKITGETEEKVQVKVATFKQRNIKKIQLIAPHFTHVATMDGKGILCIFNIMSGRLEQMKFIEGSDVTFQASPVDPLLAVIGEVGNNYGMALVRYSRRRGLDVVRKYCLTHQIVSSVSFSPTGREIMAAAMSAGHVFIFQLSLDYQLKLVRYAELGRGLADCFLMRVGDAMRAFSLVLFSDKYTIGERIVCINAETGKDNKFAGKMQGPYCRLLPLSAKDTMLAIPHLSKHFHVLQLSGDKGITISVKMGPIVDSCHDVKHFDGFVSKAALLTYGFEGSVVGRPPDGTPKYAFKLAVVHRYDRGVKQAVIDDHGKVLVTLAENHGVVVQHLNPDTAELKTEPTLTPPNLAMFNPASNKLSIIHVSDKNYLDIQEDKKVHEEHLDFKKQREEVVKNFREVRAKLVELLEENIGERPLHQLPLSEFNLHLEHKKERLKQAEKEREEIRLSTEARIKAQDKVTAWIKKTCWDTMLTPRVKLFAIFSHYQVENYAVLPTQRENWPELQQVEALRTIEMENDQDLFRPWEERQETEKADTIASNVILPVESVTSGVELPHRAASESASGPVGAAAARALWSSHAHLYAPPPTYHVTQGLAYTYLQMNWLHHIVKLNVQNMRLWFNKQFDDLMAQKKREVGLVSERNARLRFIIEELNKLSDLRGSFHHLAICISDPQWQQEEQPARLITVEPEECAIEPYISPSQVVVVAPDPGPKDDFRERALIDMMDGVLEKLWHEEIKKPIPMPNCMLEKDPEHFNEDDLRLVFEYEAKVAFRNEERDKYRKMLHAEYAKLSGVLNEGVVKFNQKVKEMWLTKLQIESVIGQENLSLMRMRRVNLDRLEMAEELEYIRMNIAKYESEIDCLQEELKQIQEQSDECQTSYDALAQKDKYMERTFKNHFADLSPIIVDQCYKYYKKRPKWHQRASMSPWVLHELAAAVLSGVRPPLLHLDVLDYFKGMEQLDLVSNMPPVMDEGLWATMCKLRRAKVENEIRMRAVVQETSFVDACANTWSRAVGARRAALTRSLARMTTHRQIYEDTARNKTIQLVLPAGQVEVVTTGHMEDFEDATLIPREDIEKINNLILKVGEMKLAMMRKQMEFRRGILAKEWEHAQMKMKLRHMEQELYSYRRLKIPKELQYYLKDKELGVTDEQDYTRMEREGEAAREGYGRQLSQQIQLCEDLELKMDALKVQSDALENLITSLNVKVSEKKLNEDPFEPIRIRRVHKKRLNTLVQRSRLIREVQDNHTTIVLLQTQLELLRLKTYPTLASFRTLS